MTMTCPSPASVRDPLRGRLAPHWQIFIGLVCGAVAGCLANALGRDAAGQPLPALRWTLEYVAEPVGQVFLRLIFMIVLPLVFSALVLGIAGLGDVRRLGRVGLRTLAWTIALSACSVAIGLGLTNALRPGGHVTSEQRAVLESRFEQQAGQKLAEARGTRPVRDALLDLIPRNPLRDMVFALDSQPTGGGMLAVLVFAVIFGIALTLRPQRTAPLVGVLEGVYDVAMVIIGLAMRLAPLAVAALVFRLTADLGLDILRMLAWYVLTVLAGLALQMFGVYSVVVAVGARLNPLRFFARTSEAALTAFATSSSNATLPTSLRIAEQQLGLRREIGSFVLTVGSTANQNGTALYEGVTVLFLAQVFGPELTLTQQVTVALLAILAGVGTAGVPSGSLPMIVMVLQTVGVPPDSIGIILGVDRLLDMCRTTLNVTGDLAVAACVDRGAALPPAPRSPVATR